MSILSLYAYPSERQGHLLGGQKRVGCIGDLKVVRNVRYVIDSVDGAYSWVQLCHASARHIFCSGDLRLGNGLGKIIHCSVRTLKEGSRRESIPGKHIPFQLRGGACRALAT